MHRLILHNPRLAQRRVLFEALGIIAYTIAVALCVFNILTWKDHASFVISCTILWAVLSASVVARLLWTNANSRDKKVLEVPESWDESFVNPQQDSLPTTRDKPGVVHRQTLPTDEDPRSGSTLLNNKLQEASLSDLAITGSGKVEPDPKRGGVPDPQILGRNRKRLTRFRKKRNSTSSANNLGVYTQKAFVKSRCDCS